MSSSELPVPWDRCGAVEQQIMHHAIGLKALGHEVCVITVGRKARSSTETRSGVKFHSVGRAWELTERRSRVGLLESEIRFGLRAAKMVRQLKPEFVHFHARYPCFIHVRAAARLPHRIRVIYHAHNWKAAERATHREWRLQWLAARICARIERDIARRCAHVCTVSEFMREEIIRSSGVSPDKVSVLDNVVDTERFRPDPRIQRRSGIVFVGRVAAEKGVSTLIRALPEVVRALPDTTLEIVGPDRSGARQGRYLGMCRNLVRETGLEGIVSFTGEIENHAVPEIIRRHKVLAVPSLWNEPCGMAVLEGLACGTPVVASRVGAVPGLIEEGITGLLVKPGDPAAWADALVSALRDARLIQTCSVRGPRFVARHHTWECVSPRLRATYARLCEGEDSDRTARAE